MMYAEGVCDGKKVQEHPQRFHVDGAEHPVPGAPGMLAKTTRPDPNTLLVVARNGETVVGEGSYVVSADGSTLTATVTGIDAQQRRFQTTVVWERM
jgi:hypothetical protein